MRISDLNESRHSLRESWLAATLLFALTLALFSQAMGGDYLTLDDIYYVQYNTAVQNGLSRQGLIYAFTTYDVGTWAPLTWLSFMTDTTVFGPRPSSYHMTNIFLHAAAGVCLFLALKSLTNSFWRSLLVAGIFLAHPLRSESVIWISERKDVLFGLFWFFGLWAYGRYVRQPGALRYTVVFLSFICGMMSKFMMVTFPFVLLLLDFWPLGRAGKNWAELRACAARLAREKIPFFLASLVFLYLTTAALNSQHTLHTMTLDGAGRVLRIFQNYFFYLSKILWPTSLNIIYPVGQNHLWTVCLGGGLLAGVSILAVRRMWDQPWLLVGWLWFVGALAPVIGVVSFSYFCVADRYTYLPSVGLTISLVFGAAALLRRLGLDKRIGFVAGASLLLGCVLTTVADLPRWNDSVSLFEDATRKAPHSISWLSLGNGYLFERDYKSAHRAFTKAIELNPELTEALNNRAFLWCRKKEYSLAIRDYTASIKADPKEAQTYDGLGNVYSAMGNYEQALENHTRAIQLRPDFAVAFNNRAYAFLKLKKYDEARKDVERCRQLGLPPAERLLRDLAEIERQTQH